VTLQFIGRFARTTAPNLGVATFFALASDMEVEKVKLYQDGSIWEEIIPNLSGRRIQEEETVREALSTFTASGEEGARDASDLSLYSLRPYHHVKLYVVGPDIDIGQEIEFPAGMEVIHRHVSEEMSTAVYVVQRQVRPEWTTVQDFNTTDYHLIVVFYERNSGLLFICSSLRTDGLYDHIANEYAEDDLRFRIRGPSMKRLNKVLLDLDGIRFFNIGMRKSVLGDNSEAYRTIAGSNADEAIDQSAGRSFRRGHWYGSAISDGESVTIGLSSAAKLWSNKNTQIPGLIEWCKELAHKITSERIPRTYGGLDLLSTGEDLTSIPVQVIFVDWHEDAYKQPVTARYTNNAGHTATTQLLDLDLQLVYGDTNERQVAFIISDSELRYYATFSLDTDRFIHARPDNDREVIVDEPNGTLEDYLNTFLPVFFTADLEASRVVHSFRQSRRMRLHSI